MGKLFSTEVEEFLNGLGYEVPENKEEIEEALINSTGLICNPLNKAVCKCGMFISPKKFTLDKLFMCVMCNNKNWSISKTISNRYKNMETTKRIVVNKENNINIELKKVKYKIDWEEVKVDIKEENLLYELNINDKELYEIKDGLKKKARTSIYNRILHSWKDRDMVVELRDKYNGLVNKDRKINFMLDNRLHLFNLNMFMKYVKYPNLLRIDEYFDNSLLGGSILEDSALENNKSEILNLSGTNPKEILNLPSSILKTLRENSSNLGSRYFIYIRDFLNKYGVEETGEVLGKGYYTLNFLKGYSVLRSNDISKRSILTYIPTAIDFQGFTNALNVLNYYSDYVRMSTEIGVGFEKSPKSLKLVHDVRSKDYKIILSAEERAYFKKRYLNNGYEQELKYNGESYKVIVPKEPEDVVREGQTLGHCVSSYVSRVVRGECLILFLRKVELETKCYVTMEIDDMGNLVQAKGRNNRGLSRDETEVLKMWCKNNKVMYYV